MKSLFVTSAGTEIGKTFVTAALVHQLRQQGKQARAIKPVMSGYEVDDAAASDAGILLTATGEPVDEAAIVEISPWRFGAPLSPHMAAAQEGKSIVLSEVVDFCTTQAKSDGNLLLIEGVGGVMAPLSDSATVLDWMAALGAPALLVVGSYLGGISHALTALNTLFAKGIAVTAIIVCESPDSPVDLKETAASIGNFAAGTPIAAVPRLDSGDSTAWRRAPDLTYLLAD